MYSLKNILVLLLLLFEAYTVDAQIGKIHDVSVFKNVKAMEYVNDIGYVTIIKQKGITDRQVIFDVIFHDENLNYLSKTALGFPTFKVDFNHIEQRGDDVLISIYDHYSNIEVLCLFSREGQFISKKEIDRSKLLEPKSYAKTIISNRSGLFYHQKIRHQKAWGVKIAKFDDTLSDAWAHRIFNDKEFKVIEVLDYETEGDKIMFTYLRRNKYYKGKKQESRYFLGVIDSKNGTQVVDVPLFTDDLFLDPYAVTVHNNMLHIVGNAYKEDKVKKSNWEGHFYRVYNSNGDMVLNKVLDFKEKLKLYNDNIFIHELKSLDDGILIIGELYERNLAVGSSVLSTGLLLSGNSLRKPLEYKYVISDIIWIRLDEDGNIISNGIIHKPSNKLNHTSSAFPIRASKEIRNRGEFGYMFSTVKDNVPVVMYKCDDCYGYGKVLLEDKDDYTFNIQSKTKESGVIKNRPGYFVEYNYNEDERTLYYQLRNIK